MKSSDVANAASSFQPERTTLEIWPNQPGEKGIFGFLSFELSTSRGVCSDLRRAWLASKIKYELDAPVVSEFQRALIQNQPFDFMPDAGLTSRIA